MAGQYDGQSASAFTKGLQSGYGFIDKAFAAQDEAEKRKLLIEKQKKENELYDVAMQNARNQQQTAEQEQITKMNQEMQQMQQVQKKQNGAVASQDLNSLIVAGDTATRDKAIQTVSAKMRANPSAYEAFGVKPNSSINVVNIADTKHKAKLTEYLNAQGISAEAFEYDTTTEEGKTAWSNKITEYANQLPALMVDGTFVPLSELGIAVGSSLQMTPDQAKMQETNWATLQKLSDDMPVDERPEQPAAQEMPQGADLGARPTGEDLLSDAELSQQGYIGEEQLVDTAMGALAPEGTMGPVDERPAQRSESYTDETPRGKTDGSRSWRNKNPGNIEAGNFAEANGSIGSDGRFAIFPTEEAGENAMRKLIFEGKNYKDLPLKDAIARYAPSSENNVPAYIKATGVNPDTKMKDFTPEQQDTLIANMKRHEGWTEGEGLPKESEAQDVISKGTKDGSGLDEWDMEKVYALLGKTYPGKETNKMKEFEFLSSKFGEDVAYDAIWGSGSKTGVQKEVFQLMDMINDPTVPQWQRDTAQKRLNRITEDTYTISQKGKIESTKTRVSDTATPVAKAGADAILDTAKTKNKKQTTTVQRTTRDSSAKEVNDAYLMASDNAKGATTQRNKDATMVGDLQRNDRHLVELEKAIDNGDYQSGWGKAQWNDLMTAIPFDKARDWTFGDARTWLERNTDFKGAVLDVLASDVKGAASDRDMQVVSEMLGGGSFNPKSLLDVVKRQQTNAVDRAKGSLSMDYQGHYLDQIGDLETGAKAREAERADIRQSEVYNPAVSNWKDGMPVPPGYVVLRNKRTNEAKLAPKEGR